MELAEYLKVERGRMARVAKAVGIAPAYLSQIANWVRPCPPERGADLERACAMQVRRWNLRPDDWFRIWPELVGIEGAPEPVPLVMEVGHGV